MIKEILFVEPFYGGSHKSWIQHVIKHSKHNYDLLTLPDKFWKWRMYGAAVKLADEFNERSKVYDSIIFSDMIDLTTFLSLTRFKIPKETKIILYFHENQFAYPWKEDGEDKNRKWDIHYGFTNFTSALSADLVLYNSKHNMESFLDGARKVLRSMPDARITSSISKIREKSKVLPLGMDLPKEVNKKKREVPLILWNHRWEFDKNPEEFFEALIELKNEGLSFELALLGESYKNTPAIFTRVIDELGDNIIYEGFLSGQAYKDVLLQATHIPVTSIHDFFGISIMEAIAYGALPLLPTRLSYPELYHPDMYPEIFYGHNESFKDRLKNMLLNPKDYEQNDYIALTKPYNWETMIKQYDDIF